MTKIKVDKSDLLAGGWFPRTHWLILHKIMITIVTLSNIETRSFLVSGHSEIITDHDRM